MQQGQYDDFLRLETTTTIQEEKEGWYAFHDTVFWGDKGGMPADTGWINELRVSELRWENDTLYHKVEGRLENPIRMRVDLSTRLINTSIQSALHLMDGYYRRRGSYIPAIGVDPGHQWYEVNEKNLTEKDLQEAQEYMNRAILDDIPVEFQYISGKDYPDEKYQHFESVRIVRFGELDEQPCGTPHLSSTGQIGSFVILGKENSSRGTRIHVACNLAANQMLQKQYQDFQELERSLKAKREEVVDRIKALQDSEKNMAKQAEELQRELDGYRAERIASSSDALVILENTDAASLRNIGQYLLTRHKLGKILLSEKDGKTNLVIVSPENQARDLLRKFSESAQIRGGGSPQLVNGQSVLSPSELKDLFLPLLIV